MIGSLLTRGLALIFGYIYPAYECFKTVEMNKPDIYQLRFWCQYWILVAGLTVCERICDMFIGWVPMYGEAKLAFFIYLWFPKTKGTTYVYDSFFRPYVAKHEPEIDRNLLELRIRAADMAVSYWQKVAIYAQTRVFDVLRYFASQSSPPRSVQPQQERPKVQKPGVPSIPKSPIRTLSHDSQASSPSPNASTSEQQPATTEEAGPSQDSKAKSAPMSLTEQKKTPTVPPLETKKSSTSNQLQVMQVDAVSPAAKLTPQPSLQEVLMEEQQVRVTRARSRRTRPPPSDR